MSDDVVQITRRINQGGLMLCCVATLDSFPGPDTPGLVLLCVDCNEAMILDEEDNTWKWFREYAAEA